MTGSLRWALRIGAAALFIAYPMLVYAGLLHWSPRVAALALLALVVPLAVMRLRHVDRAALRGVAAVPLLIAVVLGLAAALNAAGYMLAVPVVVNGALLVAFGATLLRAGVPMIERFARLQVSDLAPAELRWCRAWTVAWCAFFAVNAAIAAALAAWASLTAWALYNGLIAYVLMGLMFTAEYIPRKVKFARWSDGPLDRLVARLVPARHRPRPDPPEVRP